MVIQGAHAIYFHGDFRECKMVVAQHLLITWQIWLLNLYRFTIGSFANTSWTAAAIAHENDVDRTFQAAAATGVLRATGGDEAPAPRTAAPAPQAKGKGREGSCLRGGEAKKGDRSS